MRTFATRPRGSRRQSPEPRRRRSRSRPDVERARAVRDPDRDLRHWNPRPPGEHGHHRQQHAHRPPPIRCGARPAVTRREPPNGYISTVSSEVAYRATIAPRSISMVTSCLVERPPSVSSPGLTPDSARRTTVQVAQILPSTFSISGQLRYWPPASHSWHQESGESAGH